MSWKTVVKYLGIKCLTVHFSSAQDVLHFVQRFGKWQALLIDGVCPYSYKGTLCTCAIKLNCNSTYALWSGGRPGEIKVFKALVVVPFSPASSNQASHNFPVTICGVALMSTLGAVL